MQRPPVARPAIAALPVSKIRAVANAALMIAMQAILSLGDRVVVLAPTWPSLTEIPCALRALPHRAHLTATADGFQLLLDGLLKAITPSTRLVIPSSPANPTGWTLPAEQPAPILDRCSDVGA